MALTLINVGSSANDGTGDLLRAAFQKCNTAFTQVDANTDSIAGKLNLTGGTLTGALTVNTTSGESLLLQKAGTTFLRVKDSGFFNGAVLEALGSIYGGQINLSSVSGGCYFGRRDSTSSEGGYEAFIGNYNGSGICIRGTGSYSFGPDTGNNLHSARYASFYYGGALNTIQMGANHASTPTAQTFKAHNVTTGTGASLELAGGTGSVARGAVTLNGGNRAAYVAPVYIGLIAGGGTVDVSALETALSAVSSNVDAVINALISHGLMAAA